jgi:hypothetical protein
MSAALDAAALTSEVSNLKEGHAALRGDFRDLKADVGNGFASMSAKLDVSLGEFRGALDQKTSTNWTPIAIVVSALTAVGATAVSAIVALGISFYGGLREQSAKHETTIESLRERQVPRVEHERVWREQADDAKLVTERLRRLFEENVKTQIDLAFIKGQLNPLPPAPRTSGP